MSLRTRKAASKVERSRRQRARPSSLSWRNTASSANASQTSAAPREICNRSAREIPAHGARSTASHAVRSPRCSSAHTSMMISRTMARSCSGSMSTARKAMPLARKPAAISRACVLARTSTTMRQSGCRSACSAIMSAIAADSSARVAKPRSATPGAAAADSGDSGTAAALKRDGAAIAIVDPRQDA